MQVKTQHARKETPRAKPSLEHARNPGIPLELDWIREVRVNRSAVERRAATLGTRRSVKKHWQAAWLLKAITCIDLTTLSGDDTPGRVRRLCAKARQPVRQDILEALGVGELGLTTAAVCVYHTMVETAVRALEGSGIPVAAVSTGFPHGLSPYPHPTGRDRGLRGGRRRRRSTSSSPGAMSSRATGRPYLTRWPPSGRRAERLI